MKTQKPVPLMIAVRVFPDSPSEGRSKSRRGRAATEFPENWFVLDTETRTDATQKLIFGSYRIVIAGRCREEGLFYPPDLPNADRRVLEEYAVKHRRDDGAAIFESDPGSAQPDSERDQFGPESRVCQG